MKNIEILLVDDDPINNFVMNKVLTFKNGLDLKIYEYPEKALEYIKDNKDRCEFLILLDLHMFLIDGWKFLIELDKNSLSSEVIIITSSDSKIDKQRASSNKRVIDYLVKPLGDEEIAYLKDKIEKMSI